MARGLWKGAISFGLVNVPVELFSAEKRSAEIDLTMLDKRDLAPVGYKRVIKTRQYLAAVIPQDDVLLMDTLRYADEIKEVDDLGIPKSALHAKATPKEIDMALRLIEDMSDKWQPEKFKDTYRNDLMARIKEKIKKGQTEEITEPEKGEKEKESAEVIDLMALLKKSVQKPKPKRKAARRSAKRAA